ncbi:MAG: efflux RND transporter periplasmic adaptor subunit [Proteobacteria bacterium]|nr:efflux RND transporter periplasmic adaptor subunit [Pseudomonadota bacterium]
MMRRIIPSFIVLMLIFMGLSCNKSPQANTKEKRQDVKTLKVACMEVQTFIEATGSVQPDLTGSSRLASPLTGTVGQIFIKVGDRVKKGDPLLLIKSPEATDTYSSYLSTVIQLNQAERIYSLNKQLFEIGAITKNDLLNSESSFKQIKAVSDGIKRKLQLFGCHIEDNIAEVKQTCSDAVTVRAPIDGYVADIPIHVGDRVDTSTPLMTIADPQNIVIVANIYDTDIPKIKKGNTVQFSTDTFHDLSFSGVVTYISDISDTESKTVKTFIKINDRKDIFKQNMFLKIKIQQKKISLPVISQSAMIYKEGKFYVYIPNKNNSYDLKDIRPVREMPDKTVAIEGLNEGDTIVISAIELEKP